MPKKIQKDIIHAKGVDIGIYTEDYQNEYLSLTDIARYKSSEPKDVVKNWMRGKDTIEFASWISPEFKLYIIKDYNRLKHDENSRLSLSWNLNREISKLNYRIHTDAYIELLGA